MQKQRNLIRSLPLQVMIRLFVILSVMIGWNLVASGQFMKNSGVRIVIDENSGIYLQGDYFTTSAVGTIALDGTLSLTGYMTATAGTLFSSPDATGVLKLTGHTTNYLSQPGILTVDGLWINLATTLTLTPNQQMTIKGSLVVDGTADLYLQSSGESTASLIMEGSATGSVICQRHIDGWTDNDDGWHLLSSPVIDQSVNPNFTVDPETDYDFYLWSEPDGLWVNYKNSTEPPTFFTANGNSNNFVSGRGYLVAYKYTYTKMFSGSLHSSSVVVSGLTNTEGDTHTGWNLVGNPFSCALKWNKTSGPGGWNLNNIGGIAKVWDESEASYTDISQGEIIPATQGFMVQVSDAGTGSLNLFAGDRTHSPINWYKDHEVNVIRLRAVDPAGSKSQETVIRFHEAATGSFDADYDAHFLGGYAPQFYSVSNGHEVSTNALSMLTDELRIPLYFIKNENTLFSIEADSLMDLIPAYPVYLTDRKLGVTQNLTRDRVYTFIASDGDDPYRFDLHFKAVGVSESQPTSSVQIWSNDQTLYIRNPHSLTGIVDIVSMTGQRILQVPLTDELLQQHQLQVATGVYYVRVYGQQVFGSRKVFFN